MRGREPHEPQRVPLLERLARDGDAYAMYALSRVLQARGGRGDAAAAARWMRRAAPGCVRAQRHLMEPEELPRQASPQALATAGAWARRAARSRHPEALRAAAWTVPAGPRMRAALERAARAGSAGAAYDLATVVETLRGRLAYVRRWLRFAVVVGMHGDDEEYAEVLVERASPFLRRFAAHPGAWRARAAAADPEARVHLAYARRFGRAEPYDPSGAQAAFETAARAGSAEAAIALALEVHDPEMDVDYDAGAAWAERAAASGDPVALWLAGDLNLEDPPRRKRRAVAWLRRAAAAGEPRAAFRLACGHAYGGFVPRDPSAARRWARVAARGGHEGAMALLARLLEEARHATRRERAEAASWRRRAAECGNFDDWTNWGVRLHEGNGVRRDDRAAVRWYRRAAAHGCPSATANLGRCYRRGHGVPKSPRRAVRWFRRAAEVFDSAQAAHCLAEMYCDGELGRPDPRRALRWWRRAAALGDREALEELGLSGGVT